MKRQYWSQRKGITAKYTLSTLIRAIKAINTDFGVRGYFQEYYGYYCVDAGYVSGKAGDVSEFIFRKIRRELYWDDDNPNNIIDGVDEDTLFDMIELYHDTVSFPIEGYFHSYSQCGYHYSVFDTAKGQEEYRREMNTVLIDYEDGYELNPDGEIQILLTPGLKELTGANIPTDKNEDSQVKNKVDRAIKKYRDWHSSFEDRKDAVRELADVLEYLRPTVKHEMLRKDEDALFIIANDFSIRHNNKNQKEINGSAWLSWVFYLYLSTIHLCLRIRKGNDWLPKQRAGQSGQLIHR